MMSQEDAPLIRRLLDQGCHVEVVNPEAEGFARRYQVYRDFEFSEPGSARSLATRKAVIVNNEGRILGEQG